MKWITSALIFHFYARTNYGTAFPSKNNYGMVLYYYPINMI